MFNIGDKVVYPLYGAGIVEGLEEKQVENAKKKYYVLNIPVGNLKVVLAADKIASLGVRKIITPEELEIVLHSIKLRPIEMSDNWNQRYKENMEKIKSGNLLLVCEVYRNLQLREKERGLSNAEKKLLTSAKQILVSEVILVHDIEKEEAETKIMVGLCL